MSIDLRIDELVLHGFPAASRRRIARALQTELTRLMTQQARSGEALGGSFARDDLALDFRIPHDATPERTGRALARSVHQNMSPAPASRATSPARSTPRR
jgi:hypothetical protein